MLSAAVFNTHVQFIVLLTSPGDKDITFFLQARFVLHRQGSYEPLSIAKWNGLCFV